MEDNPECSACLDGLYDEVVVVTLGDEEQNSKRSMYTDDLITLKCKHTFHQRCLNRHAQYKVTTQLKYMRLGAKTECKVDCPMCRFPLTSNNDEEEKGDRLFDSINIKPDEEEEKLNFECYLRWFCININCSDCYLHDCSY